MQAVISTMFAPDWVDSELQTMLDEGAISKASEGKMEVGSLGMADSTGADPVMN